MRWMGYRQVRISSVKMDVADIRKRSKAAHVSDLAGSIRESGEELIHAPTVRAQTKTLLCGRDRMAAVTILKLKKVWVHLVECDDREAQQLELTENIYRRPITNRSEMIAQLVELKTQQIAAEQSERAAAEGVTLSQAPQAQPRAIARKSVAKAAGISTAAVRQAEVRAAAPEEPVAYLPPEETRDPALNLLGVSMDDAYIVDDRARAQQRAIDETDKHLRLALAGLKPIEGTWVGQELRQQVQRVGELVRSARPAALCPWCKGISPIMLEGDCRPCNGDGFVPAEKLEASRCPRELLDTEHPAVAIHGVFYPYEDVRDGKLPAKNGEAKKPERRIRVEDENGRDLTIERDADEAY